MTAPATATTTPTTAPPTFEAVVEAGRVVAEAVGGTPQVAHPLLGGVVGADVVVKHEHVLPTGSFKVRGGAFLSARLSPEELAAGVVTASTGNHAQSVAYAARLAGISATVVMPSCAPQVKRDAVAALGAEVVIHGETLSEAASYARTGERAFVDPTDPRIVMGHATAYLELFRAEPGLASVYVPIGSGTGAAGACVVRDALAPGCRVVGVQSSAAPAGWRSWRSGSIEQAPSTTRASGLATVTGYPGPQAVLARGLDDFQLVSDDEIDAAARLLATHAHTLAEGAGAASLAGLLADDEAARGRGRVAVIVTGANASADEIARIAAR
ncbi:MAG: pyridoxal-phosphate dependent enzyme [Nocardioidaceae bacterium]|nr:pyridoxal-phosphate dependent enzyme [Nocardioidaceae bacterium]MCL2614396.1 pyridoxal-phosphate dependent enzyme [Nocardioidaceae bacterium]